MGPNQKKLDELEARIRRLGIRMKEIEEKFIRSSGKGGQNVNKVATCVFLKHKPTGITVKHGSARSQNLNRFLAMRLLVDKIEEKVSGKSSKETLKIEKLKKQKKKRKKRAKSKTVQQPQHMENQT